MIASREVSIVHVLCGRLQLRDHYNALLEEVIDRYAQTGAIGSKPNVRHSFYRGLDSVGLDRIGLDWIGFD